MCLKVKCFPLSRKCQVLLISELPKKKYNLVQAPCFYLAKMLRHWWISRFCCKEEWLKLDRQTALTLIIGHHWGIWFQRCVHGAHMGRWSSDCKAFHSSSLPWHRSSNLQNIHPNLLCDIQNHCSTPFFIIGSKLACPVPHGQNSRALRLEGSSKLYTLLLQSMNT